MGLLMPAVLFDVRFALIQATNVGNNHTVYICCMQFKSFQIQIIGEKKEEKQNQKEWHNC